MQNFGVFDVGFVHFHAYVGCVDAGFVHFMPI